MVWRGRSIRPASRPASADLQHGRTFSSAGLGLRPPPEARLRLRLCSGQTMLTSTFRQAQDGQAQCEQGRASSGQVTRIPKAQVFADSDCFRFTGEIAENTSRPSAATKR